MTLLRTLVIVMPAHNEAEGLPSFVREVLHAVRTLADSVRIIVVDDKSTDDTAAVLSALSGELPELSVERSQVNRGHGPTALAAYRAGSAAHPDAIVHVDGDGQFIGDDIAAVARALADADVVHGVRFGRTDPWFRRLLTRCVGAGVTMVIGRHVPDVNTPLRAYRLPALRTLLARVGEDALVPHVLFSIIETRLGLRRAYVPVRSIPRRGSTTTGTMWGAAPRVPRLPPRRLIVFCLRAGREVCAHLLVHHGARPEPDPTGHPASQDAEASAL